MNPSFCIYKPANIPTKYPANNPDKPPNIRNSKGKCSVAVMNIPIVMPNARQMPNMPNKKVSYEGLVSLCI